MGAGPITGLPVIDTTPGGLRSVFATIQQAALSLAPFGLIGSGTFLSCYDAAIEEHSNGLVPGEPAREMFVEMRAIACDDDELPNHLRWVVVPFRRRHVTAPRMTRRRGLRQEPRHYQVSRTLYFGGKADSHE